MVQVDVAEVDIGGAGLLGSPRQSRRIAGQRHGSGGAGGIAGQVAALGSRLLLRQPGTQHGAMDGDSGVIGL